MKRISLIFFEYLTELLFSSQFDRYTVVGDDDYYCYMFGLHHRSDLIVIVIATTPIAER